MTSKCKFVLAVFLLAGSTFGVAAKNQSSWPLVRANPLQTGVADTALPDKLDVLWTFKADDAFEGTAAIAGGVVYIGNYDENLYALDLKTGHLKWKYKMGPTKAAPAVYKGFVYIGDEDGVLHCVDAKTGTKRWIFETQGEITATANFYKEKIVIPSQDGTLYCLSPKGKKIWGVATDGPVFGSTAIVDNWTFVAGCDSELHKINLNTGKQKVAIPLGGQSGATPAVFGDRLFVGMITEQVLAIDWKKEQVAWAFEPKRRSNEFRSSAAVTEKLVLIGGRNRKLYALDRNNGKKLWEFETGRWVDPSPVVAGQRVYAPSMDGKLYVLDLKSGKKIQELLLGRSIVGSPAVAENRLVIGTTNGALYCLGQKK